MSQPPLFSIVTPSFNALAGLHRTWASVQAQSPDLFEYLVIDGASTDGTVEWLEQHGDSRLRWISEPDAGVYDAMNKGVKLARGEFLCFLGAQDLLRPNILAEALRFIAGLPQDRPRFIYGNVRMMTEGGRVSAGCFNIRKICAQNICHQAIFYDRAIFDRLGTFELRYPIYADWAFNLRCFGDRSIARYYWNEIIADYAGGGLSDRVPDVPFDEDRVPLIRERLGRWPAWQFRLEQKFQRGLHRLRRRAA